MYSSDGDIKDAIRHYVGPTWLPYQIARCSTVREVCYNYRKWGWASLGRQRASESRCFHIGSLLLGAPVHPPVTIRNQTDRFILQLTCLSLCTLCPRLSLAPSCSEELWSHQLSSLLQWPALVHVHVQVHYFHFKCEQRELRYIIMDPSWRSLERLLTIVLTERSNSSEVSIGCHCSPSRTKRSWSWGRGRDMYFHIFTEKNRDGGVNQEYSPANVASSVRNFQFFLNRLKNTGFFPERNLFLSKNNVF